MGRLSLEQSQQRRESGGARSAPEESRTRTGRRGRRSAVLRSKVVAAPAAADDLGAGSGDRAAPPEVDTYWGGDAYKNGVDGAFVTAKFNEEAPGRPPGCHRARASGWRGIARRWRPRALGQVP